jgi:hypothetical protein
MWAGSYVEPWLYRACIRPNGTPAACSDDANASMSGVAELARGCLPTIPIHSGTIPDRVLSVDRNSRRLTFRS